MIKYIMYAIILKKILLFILILSLIWSLVNIVKRYISFNYCFKSSLKKKFECIKEFFKLNCFKTFDSGISQKKSHALFPKLFFGYLKKTIKIGFFGNFPLI